MSRDNALLARIPALLVVTNSSLEQLSSITSKINSITLTKPPNFALLQKELINVREFLLCRDGQSIESQLLADGLRQYFFAQVVSLAHAVLWAALNAGWCCVATVRIELHELQTWGRQMVSTSESEGLALGIEGLALVKNVRWVNRPN